MAKKITQNALYTYTFSAAGSVECTVDGGSVKIWISGNETHANTYTATGQASSSKFGSVSLSASTNPKWVLHLRGVNASNTVSITVPSLGSWNTEPENT